MTSSEKQPLKFNFCIDRGGTFTDVFAQIPMEYQSKFGKHIVIKLLSKDDSYADAPREGIRRILEKVSGIAHPKDKPINSSRIGFIRMGTTVATNALLERKGEPTALIITEGFRDLLHIGNQSRPAIFDLKIERPEVLYKVVRQVKERVRLRKLIPDEVLPKDARVEVGSNGEKIYIEQTPDKEQIMKVLKEIQSEGIKSLSVAFLHSYTYDKHEQLVKSIALDKANGFNFNNVSLSSELMPMVKVVPRGQTTCADAYLTPCIREYIAGFTAGFDTNFTANCKVSFMQSDGGLCLMDNFCGFRAVLSGPAGGVVGYAQTTYGQLDDAKDGTNKPLIGFDMGGTSTDVSRYSGSYDHVHENTTAGVTLQAPQLDINTVASGGGSCLWFDAGLLRVGPHAAGADPGPVCYKRNGLLAITDANLMLGRVVPQYFPKIFGLNHDQPLDSDLTSAAFEKFAVQINQYNLENMEEKERQTLTPVQVAMGCVEVANETMCRPIRALTMAKGFNVKNHILSCFGGAGGQHACSIARTLGIHKVFVHRLAGILSAYGMGLADVVREEQFSFATEFEKENMEKIQVQLNEVSQRSREKLRGDGFTDADITTYPFLNLRFQGTDTALFIRGRPVKGSAEVEQKLNDADYDHYHSQFIERYKREYGFVLERPIVVDDVRCRGVAASVSTELENISQRPPNTKLTPQLKDWKAWFDVSGSVQELTTPVYLVSQSDGTPLLYAGDHIEGPALILQDTSTIVVEPNCDADITPGGDIVITIGANKPKAVTTALERVQLAIFGHRFMSIAEQMGKTLQKTSVSTNIKERLDFSCAIFGPKGGLVANAPHLPVHLGSMQEAVRYQAAKLKGDVHRGDVMVTNHPVAGGTHLPDITVITPVFADDIKDPVFWVASRGHHADIGGITPGSMPPFSRYLSEEGAAIESLKLVSQGKFNEDEIVKVLTTPSSKESSGTRNLSNNLSDLKAQIAANHKGISLMDELIKEYSLKVVQAYMDHIQNNAEEAVRTMLKRTATKYQSLNQNKTDGKVTLSAIDYMDDGTPIKSSVIIDESDGSAVFDFTGTGAMVYGNCNAPRAVTYSAIIYCLRCLVDMDIPLNQGCLNPIDVIIPENSILSPSREAAIVGGNVLTSQRVTDVILKAFNACGASQGCMNNLTFGDKTYGYYETIAGGSGAGATWHGQSGVHTHMTNTRITDPEILESRYPVVLRKFGLRDNSGGKGAFSGGDGCVRIIEFLRPTLVSILSERRSYQPYGLEGGGNGAYGLNLVYRARDNAKINIGSKRSYNAQSGDRIEVYSPGGGAWGPPQ